MTRETLLRTTVRLISEGGEAKVRLADVAQQSGLSIGAIQHHFSSREELVAAAQVERLMGNTESDISAISSLLGSSNSVSEFRGAMRAITLNVIDRSRADLRLERISSLAAIHGRPESRSAASALLTKLSGVFADVIRGLQDRGYLRPELDPAAVAVFIQAYALGMVVADLQEPAVDAESLAVVIDRFMDSVLVPDG